MFFSLFPSSTMLSSIFALSVYLSNLSLLSPSLIVSLPSPKCFIIGYLSPSSSVSVSSLLLSFSVSLSIPSRFSLLSSLSPLSTSHSLSHTYTPYLSLSVSLRLSVYVPLKLRCPRLTSHLLPQSSNSENCLANLDNYIQMTGAKPFLKIIRFKIT